MKNKKSIYILLPIVLFIWGAVIYRMFSFSHDDNSDLFDSPSISIKPLEIKKRDTVVLNVNYRDPFLGKMYVQNSAGKKIKKGKIAKPKEELIWPSIVYKGIVSDVKDKKKVFMVLINGQSFFMKEKDKEQDVILEKGNREYIVLKYKGKQNKIHLQG